jgi:hypothetical protein
MMITVQASDSLLVDGMCKDKKNLSDNIWKGLGKHEQMCGKLLIVAGPVPSFRVC